MGPKQPPSSEHRIAALFAAPGETAGEPGRSPAPAPAANPGATATPPSATNPGAIPTASSVPSLGATPARTAAEAPRDTVTVEAATAERALEEVTSLLGPDAEILRADKVQRGGIGGFFAKEVVQLTARRRPGAGETLWIQGGQATPATATAAGVNPATPSIIQSATQAGPPANPTSAGSLAPAGSSAPAAAPPSAARPASASTPASAAARASGAAQAASILSASAAGDALAATTPAAGEPAGNGLLDPFAEALGRFLADVPETAPTGNVRPFTPPATAALAAPTAPPASAAPAAPAASEIPAALEAVPSASKTPVTLEAVLPSVPAAAVPTDTASEQAPEAAPAPVAVVLDTPELGEPAMPSSALSRLAALAAAFTSATAPASPASAPSSEAEAGRSGDAAPGTGSPDWSPEGLLRLGLPVSLVRPLIANLPVTDAAWLEAVSRTIAHLCGPVALPADEAQLLIGPRAHLLAEPLRLPQTDYPDAPPATGSAVMSLHVATTDLGLVLRLLGDRRLHIVAGGEGWERLTSLRPSVVSWVGAEALPGALALCATHGLTLGYGRAATAGPAGAGSPAFRATPLDVALTLRSLVGRR